MGNIYMMHFEYKSIQGDWFYHSLLILILLYAITYLQEIRISPSFEKGEWNDHMKCLSMTKILLIKF
jgi:hypothetical protein